MKDSSSRKSAGRAGPPRQPFLGEPPAQAASVSHGADPSPLGTGVETRSLSPEEVLGPLSEIEQKFAPRRLLVAGQLGLPLAHPRVAIVGTRTPSAEGLATATELAGALARKGVTIVSGLARGIDTAAHAESIRVGGTTIAVLGTPLSQEYPRENADLQHSIMQQFLAISQFPEGQPVNRTNFVLRNRTMALIADASVIVESGDGGGSLHQGWEALRLGRPLFIHAREFDRPGLAWPRAMANYGAIMFHDAADIQDAVPSVSLGLAIAQSGPA